MKSFDLESALKGAPVMTRTGKEVTQLARFDTHSGIRLHGVREGCIAEWYEDGTTTSGARDVVYDLLMAPVKKTGWVARYPNNTMGNGMSDTEAGCKIINPGAASFHKIEWEE